MAKLLMGAIVVKASGKINGNCFRTFRGQQLLTKLALPTKTNLFRSNPQNAIMAQVFRGWALLSNEDRDLWVIIASENPVIDIWGNPKLLSGREYYTRVSSAGLLVGWGFSIASTFSKLVPAIPCSNVIIDTTTNEITLEDLGTVSDVVLEIRIVKLPNEVNNYSISKVSFCCALLSADYTQPDIVFNSVNSEIIIQAGSWYQIYMCFVNVSGVRGQYLSFKVQAT